MKDMTLETILAVLEEIFSPNLFWGLVAAAVLILLAFIYLLLKERTLASKRFLFSELIAPVGAFASIFFVQYITKTGFSDIGGPIDVIILVLIGVAGAIGLTILTYTVLGLSRYLLFGGK